MYRIISAYIKSQKTCWACVDLQSHDEGNMLCFDNIIMSAWSHNVLSHLLVSLEPSDLCIQNSILFEIEEKEGRENQ